MSNLPIPMPNIGLGTFRLKGDTVKPSLISALSLGYTHIDTAGIYRNEKSIGSVLQEIYISTASSQTPITRSSLYITSKLSPYDMKTPRKALLKSLSDLQTTYLDLYLIHWPAAARTPSGSPENKRLRIEAWGVLNEAKREGLVHEIGVSNFTMAHLRELKTSEWGLGDGIVVQMEVSPWYWRESIEILERLEGKVKVVGYALLGEGKLMGGECPKEVQEIAQRLGASKVQVILAWAIKKGLGVLVKSVDPLHLKDNLEADRKALMLTEEDSTAIDSISAPGKEEKQCWDPRMVI